MAQPTTITTIDTRQYTAEEATVANARNRQQRAEDLFVSHLRHRAHLDNARRQQRGSGLQQARLQQRFAAAGHVGQPGLMHLLRGLR